LGPVVKLAAALPSGSSRWNYLRQNARRFRDAAMLEDSFQRFFAGTQISSVAMRKRLYAPDFLARQEWPDAFRRLEDEYFADGEAQALDPLEQFMLADLTVHMPGSLLNRLDRAS